MKLSDQKIAILGCGRSGIAAAKLALAQGATELCLFDSNAHAQCPDAKINFVPAACEQQAQNYAADLIILSPGIDGSSPWVQAFLSKESAKLIGETEFAYRYFTGKTIAITGTNGKTTTTALIEHIFCEAGRKATACGNYGTPLSEVLLKEPDCEYAILEVSSFQMESIERFCPDIAIWLNFAPDHMDRYKLVQDYFEAKKRVFDNMGDKQLAIIRKGEDLDDIRCPRQEFSAFEDGAQLSYHEGSIIENGQALISLSNTRLYQAHNAENAMAALLCSRAMGISDACIQSAIQSFVPPSHRCEMVAHFDGVLWLNDSKSTNIHSTQAAIRSQTQACILIMGGKDKGLEYSELAQSIKGKIKLCICFGQIQKQLIQDISPYCPCIAAETVEESVEIAYQKAQSGEVVLFSPATSSFDQFNSYVQRGECFRNAVLNTVKP